MDGPKWQKFGTDWCPGEDVTMHVQAYHWVYKMHSSTLSILLVSNGEISTYPLIIDNISSRVA